MIHIVEVMASYPALYQPLPVPHVEALGVMALQIASTVFCSTRFC